MRMRKFKAMWLLRIITLAVIVTLGVATLVVLLGNDEKHAVAYFRTTTGLYEGDDVRVLGVDVGEIDNIEPAGARTRVEFHYDAQQPIPSEAKAVIVAPTPVTARFVQLVPAYGGGPVLHDGATIPLERTTVPVEFDQVKKQLSKLATALGPKGANQTGSLSRLLDSIANAGQGQGSSFHDAIKSVSHAIETISQGRDDLFGTVRDLQLFVSALAKSGQQIVELNRRLASVSGMLANNRDELDRALTSLSLAVGEVETFVQNNRTELRTSVKGLAEVTRVLVEKQQELAKILHLAPTTLANFYNIYSPIRGSLTGALAAVNVQTPAAFICSAIGGAASMTPQRAAEVCARYLGPLLKRLALNYPPVGLNPVIRKGPEVVRQGGPTSPSTAVTPERGSAIPNLRGLLTGKGSN